MQINSNRVAFSYCVSNRGFYGFSYGFHSIFGTLTISGNCSLDYIKRN